MHNPKSKFLGCDTSPSSCIALPKAHLMYSVSVRLTLNLWTQGPTNHGNYLNMQPDAISSLESSIKGRGQVQTTISNRKDDIDA
jgi:hypothetical protein